MRSWEFIMAATILTAATGAGPHVGAQAPAREGPPSAPEYEVVAKGLLGSRIFPLQFRSADLRLEIRNLVMGPGKAQRVPIRTRTIMELRGGAVLTTIDGDARARRPGDFWEVAPGSTLTIENPGDVAVIRAIAIYEGRR